MPYYEKSTIVFFSICLLFTNTNGISNTSFNTNIRDYSTNEDIRNLTSVQTLQREDKGRYRNFSPIGNPKTFEEIPDNVLSGSSQSRGLLHHEVPGYVIGDYEEIPHYGHGYEYHSHDDHHEPHGYKHQYDHHDSGYHLYPGYHHLDYGHHYKHQNHAVAAKTLLWPIAGIALLGAAAALVSNPILLQLGVVSGRKKRNTEEFSTESIPNLQILSKKYYNTDDNSNKQGKGKLKKRMFQWNVFKDVEHGVPRNTQLQGTTQNLKIIPNLNSNDDDRFIPIPLKFKN